MLTNWDPFREMMTMRRAVDRLIDNSMPNSDWNTANDWGFPLDVVENENEFIIKASVPGVKPEQLEITFSKGLLTIKGETRDESESNKGQYHLRERRFGIFSRTISLPATVKADDIQAKCEDGILTLSMPKSEEVKPKRIQIQSGSSQKIIEAKNN